MSDTSELAKGYTLVNDTQYKAGQYLLEKLALTNTPNIQILDIGCGPGNLTAYISSLLPDGKVVGIDPSSSRIALALSAYERHPNLSFFEGVAENLARFGNESFDAVVMNSTFHWVGDQEGALRECFRVLKGGGKLGISGGSGDFEALHEKIKREVLGREPYVRFVEEESGPRFLKKSEMEEMLGKAGFESWKIGTNAIVKVARDGEDMLRWLDVSSSGKTYGGIPAGGLRECARRDMLREWEGYVGESGIRMQMELLVTVAVKG